MRVVAWNYNPAPGTIKRLVEVGFRYPYRPENDLPNPIWSWDNVTFGWNVNGDVNATIDDAVEALTSVRVLAFSNLWWWNTFLSTAPEPFTPESRDKHNWLISKLCLQLHEELGYRRLGKINLVFDLESWEKTAKPLNPGYSPPNLILGSSYLTKFLHTAGWPRDPSTGWANFGCSNTHKSYKCGTNNRVTPTAMPGFFDGKTAFPIGYTGEFMTEVEMLDAIDKCPAPTWLALHQRQPGLVNILLAAKNSGKVQLITIWVGTPAVSDAQLHDPTIDALIAEAVS